MKKSLKMSIRTAAFLVALTAAAGAVPFSAPQAYPCYAAEADGSAEYTEGTYGVLTYKKYSDHVEISGCDKEAESVVIPFGIDGVPVTAIGPNAFEECKLSSVTIPSSVKDIGSWSFAFCENLKAVEIPEGVRVIENDAFANCYSLEEVKLNDGLEEICQGAFSDCTKLRSVTLPEGLLRLRSGAFTFCTSLEEVIFPENQVDVYGNVFQETPWLKARQSEDPLVIVNGTLIDGKACTGDVVIPEGVTIVAAEAFAMNSNITSVVVPESVEYIWNETFYYCSSLKSVEFKGVKYIGGHTFSGCPVLTDIRLPYTLETIAEDAFWEYINSSAVITYSGTEKQWKKVDVQDKSLLFYIAKYSYTGVGFDVNADGEFGIADAVALQKWLLGDKTSELKNWRSADVNDD